MQSTQHISVLLEESVEALCLSPGMVVVDATFGGGGHTLEIAKRITPGGVIIGIDRDVTALERFDTAAFREMFPEVALHLVHANYSDIAQVLEAAGVDAVDALLADLGFSSDQINTGTRGFSFQNDGPLDMRMNQEDTLTAADIVNTWSEEELSDILFKYGDEREARRIARRLVEERAEKPFETTSELRECIVRAIPQHRYKGVHPATKTFQALRMVVNQELEHVELFLERATKALSPEARLAVITFHSGEDRLVKQFFHEMSVECVCPKEFPVCRCAQKAVLKKVTKKPILPSDQEIAHNPRSRSAKLRVVEKVSDGG